MQGEVKKLVYISRKVGVVPDLVQGGGGNTSVKVDGGLMYIKASGTPLKDMNSKSGFAVVDSKGRVTISKPEQHPSMEVYMHLCLPKYVIHTHCVNVNIFLCMKNGRRNLLNLFKKERPLYIPYKNPGKQLGLEIKEQVGLFKKKHDNYPCIIFLENHGLITCDEDPEETLALTFMVNEKLKKHLKKSIKNFAPFNPKKISVQKSNHCLFPDMAVFRGVEVLTQASREITAAHDYVLYGIKKVGGKPRYLKQADVAYIKNMKEEKHRIRVAR